jgi:NADH-quinone oxidoreductase subunit M
VGNVLIVGIVTLAQRDLKQLVGYSSVMHMGYAFLGVACLSVVGVGGVVFMMVAHGFSAALLFLLSTSIHHRTQTFDLDEMGGLVKHAPVLSAFFVAATLASIGLPGFANFWGELTIFVAAWKVFPTLTIIAILGVVISAIYGLRAAARVFFGPQTEALDKVLAEKPATDLTWSEKLPALLLLVSLLALGFWPKLMTDSINDSVTAIYPAAEAVVPTDVARN